VAGNELIKDELRALFARAKMPTNPAVASAILKLSASETSNAKDFADLIRTDPSLAIRILKSANSARFAQRTQVTTIERAVTILGLSRVKATALGFQLIAHLDQLGGAPFDMKVYWQHSLLRGCLARVIATGVVPQRTEEAFLISLLQDCGIMLLVQVLGSSYASLCRADLSPAAFYATERESFPYTHVDAIEALASEWRLPLLISAPMQQHHHPRGCSNALKSEQEKLAAVAYFVGNLCFSANLQVMRDEQGLNDFGVAALALGQTTWADLQRETEAEYHSLLELFGDLLPDDIEVSELLGEANRQLVHAAEESEARFVDVEAQRVALMHERKQLQHALRDYREQSAIDPLTRVMNRGAVAEAARAAIRRNLEENVPLGALFLDIDNFKHLNDTYGHDVGDKVLKAVAALLRQEIRDDGPVGRYGGEEFVILLPARSAEATRHVAEDIVQALRRLDTTGLGCAGPVTCSVGAIWADRLPFNSAEELFGAADQLMYKAKRNGKNRACFERLTPSSSPLAEIPLAPHLTALDSPEPEPTLAPGADELLALARQLNEIELDYFAGLRKQVRKKVVAPCTLYFFTESGPELKAETAVTRNLSTGGVGLLVARPMIRGEPVEVMLNCGASRLFVAGLVSFCRHVDGTIHEIGVQFVSHSVMPIVSSEAVEPIKQHDWLQRAFSAKKAGKLQTVAAI
jgi:two-component system, cell cycle response regulator